MGLPAGKHGCPATLITKDVFASIFFYQEAFPEPPRKLDFQPRFVPGQLVCTFVGEQLFSLPSARTCCLLPKALVLPLSFLAEGAGPQSCKAPCCPSASEQLFHPSQWEFILSLDALFPFGEISLVSQQKVAEKKYSFCSVCPVQIAQSCCLHQKLITLACRLRAAPGELWLWHPP